VTSPWKPRATSSTSVGRSRSSDSTSLTGAQSYKNASSSNYLAGRGARQRIASARVAESTAGLTGEVAIAIFKISFERWVSSASRGT